MEEGDVDKCFSFIFLLFPQHGGLRGGLAAAEVEAGGSLIRFSSSSRLLCRLKNAE